MYHPLRLCMYVCVYVCKFMYVKGNVNSPKYAPVRVYMCIPGPVCPHTLK